MLYLDKIGKIPWNSALAGLWLRTRNLSAISYLFVHISDQYINPGASMAEEQNQLNDIAKYHQSKDWSDDHSGVFGWTAMYHWAIGPTGVVYALNPLAHILWNTTNGNPHGAATVLLMSKNQLPTQPQRDALRQHLDRQSSSSLFPANRRSTYGHGECGRVYGGGPEFGNDTECPGPFLVSWVKQYREGAQLPKSQPNNHYFPETNQYVSNAFWDFYRAEPKATQYFGYPISPEMLETVGGWTGTVQYFERARFEYHPNLPDGLRVQLGRVGAEISALHAGAAHGGH